MQQSHGSRNIAKALLAFCVLGLASACGDSTVSPEAAVEGFVPAGFSRKSDVKQIRFRVKDGVNARIGSHILDIPEHAVCELGASYGKMEWDKPCKEHKGSVTITAQLFEDADGNPYVKFEPAMRFDPSKTVTLFLKRGRDADVDMPTIVYCTNSGDCTDESINDATLRPFAVDGTNLLGRRLKHFSGYMIVPRGCTGEVVTMPDGETVCSSDGLARRSGYMVASGVQGRSGSRIDDEDDDDDGHR